MKYIYLGLSWVFGVLFLIAGLGSLVDTPIAAPFLLLVSALLLPPVREFVYGKTNTKIAPKARFLSILALLIGFSVALQVHDNRVAEELAAKEAAEKAAAAAEARQENIDFFNANRDQVIRSVKTALSDGDFQSAIQKADKYLVAGDAELKQLSTRAKAQLAELQKEQKTKRLLAEAGKVPASELEKNKNIYSQLASLHPENAKYKEKLAYYAGKIAKKRKEQLAAQAREERIHDQFSNWDGSHMNLARFIKNNMHDPDSYEHAKTVYSDKGDYLIVKTTYRGKNGFGGVVLNYVTAKVSLDGQVLAIIDQS